MQDVIDKWKPILEVLKIKEEFLYSVSLHIQKIYDTLKHNYLKVRHSPFSDSDLLLITTLRILSKIDLSKVVFKDIDDLPINTIHMIHNIEDDIIKTVSNNIIDHINNNLNDKMEISNLLYKVNITSLEGNKQTIEIISKMNFLQ